MSITTIAILRNLMMIIYAYIIVCSLSFSVKAIDMQYDLRLVKSNSITAVSSRMGTSVSMSSKFKASGGPTFSCSYFDLIIK